MATATSSSSSSSSTATSPLSSTDDNNGNLAPSSSSSSLPGSGTTSSTTVVIQFPDGGIAAGIRDDTNNDNGPKPDDNDSSRTSAPNPSSPYERIIREVPLIPLSSLSSTDRNNYNRRNVRSAYEDNSLIPSPLFLQSIRERTKTTVNRIGFLFTLDVLYFIILYILFAVVFRFPRERDATTAIDPTFNNSTVYTEDDDDISNDDHRSLFSDSLLHTGTLIIVGLEIIIYIIGLTALHYRSINGLGTYIMLQFCSIFLIIRSIFIYYDILFIFVHLTSVMSAIYFRILLIGIYHRISIQNPSGNNNNTTDRLHRQIEENNVLTRDINELRQILSSPSAVHLLQQQHSRLSGQVVMNSTEREWYLSETAPNNNTTTNNLSNTSSTPTNEDDYNERMVHEWQQEGLRRIQQYSVAATNVNNMKLTNDK